MQALSQKNARIFMLFIFELVVELGISVVRDARERIGFACVLEAADPATQWLMLMPKRCVGRSYLRRVYGSMCCEAPTIGMAFGARRSK